MPVQCSHCGQRIPRDDAQFCSYCGMPLAADSQAPRALKKPSVAPVQRIRRPEQSRSRSALQEQIARQPPFSSPQKTTDDSASDEQKNEEEQTIDVDWPAWPAPLTHVSVAGQADLAGPLEARAASDTDMPSESEIPARSPQIKTSGTEEKKQEQNAPARSPESQKEKTDAAAHSASLDELPTMQMESVRAEQPPSGQDEGDGEEIPVEDRPTLLVEAVELEEQSEQNPATPVQKKADAGDKQDQQKKQQTDAGDITQMNTTQMPVAPQNARITAETPLQSLQSARSAAVPPVISEQEQTSPLIAVAGKHETIAQEHVPQQGYVPFTPAYQPPAELPATPPVRPATTGRRFSVLLVTGLLLVLVLLGTGTWIFVARPFSVPEVTKPLVEFKDTGLRVALLYPNGWKYQIERDKATVRFHDSSRAFQFTLIAADAAGSSVDKFLQQQVSQQGVTNAKAGTPLSFSGATWQQTQGNVQISGANYTCTILVTEHGNRLFALVELAPQSVYSDAEQSIFGPMRQSFRFL
ncbi:MAG: zinc ribbon domain-containing protein [Ktedonobacteraceae bacterium]|nr:zinc ribbon domain-containing protein [Ktedonobacteraceae bacterium]